VTVVDTTPPALTVPAPMIVEQTSPAGAVVCYSVTATDAVGPITLTYSRASGSVFAPGLTTVFVTAKDGAGNSVTKSFTVLVQDTTAPVITIKGISNLAVYTLHGVGAPTYTVSDSGSGVNLATVLATLSAPSSASGGGMYVFTVKASDYAGNTTVVTATYFVLYQFGGFQKPLTEGGSYALGKNIPVKFRLTDSKNALISNGVAKLTVDGNPAVSGGTDVGNTFTWDGTQYIFTLSTTGLAAGDHIIQVTLDDGTVDELLINLSSGGVNVENGTLYDSSQTVMDGGWLTITGGGYKAGATVTVDVGNQMINQVTANSKGMITDKIQIPTADASGSWVITATGIGADGILRVDSTIITITPP
jgi:hypothetical protein